MDNAGWEWMQAEEERYRATVDAINRCAQAGARIDDLKTICRETGIDIRHTILGDEVKLRTQT